MPLMTTAIVNVVLAMRVIDIKISLMFIMLTAMAVFQVFLYKRLFQYVTETRELIALIRATQKYANDSQELSRKTLEKVPAYTRQKVRAEVDRIPEKIQEGLERSGEIEAYRNGGDSHTHSHHTHGNFHRKAETAMAPPSVNAVAFDSALVFFQEVKEKKAPTKKAVKHGSWFIYTANEMRPDGATAFTDAREAVAAHARVEAAMQSNDVETLATIGEELVKELQTYEEEGTEKAINIAVLMQIIQMVLTILKLFGGGGNSPFPGGPINI